MYLGIASPLTTVSVVLGSGALTAYASDLFARGEAIAERLVQGGFSPRDIAFDGDGVVQFYAIGNREGELDFYRAFYEGGVATGSATQYLMEVPGMADLVRGLNRPEGSPLLVTSMAVTRAVAMFQGFPCLRKAWLGDSPATPEIVRASPRIYCAEHLAYGIRTLVAISEGLPDSLDRYAGEWRGEIEQTIPALTDPWYRGRLIKNPAVIALAKPAGHLPRILVDDTRNNVQAALDYSLRMAVIRPRSPWGPLNCFFDDPRAMLVEHWDRQAEAIATALETLVGSMLQEGSHPELRLIDIARGSIGRFDEEPAPAIIAYRDEASLLDSEHYRHLRELRDLLSGD